jgi:hypothetical protein
MPTAPHLQNLAPNIGLSGGGAQGIRRLFRGKPRMVWTVRRERSNNRWARCGKENEWGTYAAFAHAHRLAAPLVANCALELEEPRMRQISEPPIGRMNHSHLQKHQRENIKNIEKCKNMSRKQFVFHLDSIGGV